MSDQVPAIPEDSIRQQAQRVRQQFHGDPMALILAAIDTIDQLVQANPDDTAGLARTSILVARMKRELGLLEDNVMDSLWKSMPDNEVTIEGFGLLKKRYGAANAAWHHDEVWSAIRQWAREERKTDTESGEIEDPADAALRVAREVIAQGSYRKTALRARGMDPEDVSEQTWGRRSVQMFTNRQSQEQGLDR